MPNIAVALKAEIARVARKEIRAQTQDFKKSSAQYRSQIAALRRRVDTLERQLRRATRASGRSAPEPEAGDDDNNRLRFSAKGFAAQRKRLGLSAAAMAALLGVSGQSVYKWEMGKARPRARQLEAIAGLRGIGKREAQKRLEAAG
jgi:DNA-binding XRE family transcriptional regulator